MLTLLAIAVIVVTAVYGSRVGSDERDHKVQWCIAWSCNIGSPEADTTGLRLGRHYDSPQGAPWQYGAGPKP